MQTTRRQGRLVRAAIALALLAGTAQAAEITLFLQPQFQGRQATLRGESTNLASIGFTDQVSSLVVHSGRWQLCTQPNFQGECVNLGPGEYATLDSRLNHRIESAKAIGGDGPRASSEEKYGRERYAANEGNASIELFAGPRFRGHSLTLYRDAAFMAGTGFDNRAASAIVNEGAWQVCTEPRFRGDCRTLGPGRYEDLGAAMTKEISSVRRVG
jgi:hypothetical protein